MASSALLIEDTRPVDVCAWCEPPHEDDAGRSCLVNYVICSDCLARELTRLDARRVDRDPAGSSPASGLGAV